MAVVTSMVSSTASMIRQQLHDEYVFSRGVRGQFEWIQGELSEIGLCLIDADAKAREGNAFVAAWVVDVMGVTYDADDAISFFAWMEEQRKRRTFIDKCLFFCCDLLNLQKAGVMVEAVKKNIEEISRRRSEFSLHRIDRGASYEGSSSSLSRLEHYRVATSHLEDEVFVGFDEEISALRDDLTKGERRRCVVSIVGMGGAGKTALARKLYKDSDVKAHFGSDVAWVCVSQTYRIVEVLQEIAGQMMELKRKDSAEWSEIELLQMLREFLKNRKYLIVLDDIWTTEAWDLLKDAFTDGNEGSRILLTTRYLDVAKYADRMISPHKLRLLNDDESLNLFLKIVFPPLENNGKPICPPQLEGIARQMVTKCGGLPLAIRVLGGLSFTVSDDKNVWQKVLDHDLKSQLFHETTGLHDILALSYLDLPDYLKTCFLYLGIFPEDYEISVEKLTRLWIAEGFIQATGNISREDVAEQCVSELAKRSMLQVIHFSNFCRVQVALRYLAIREAKRVGLFEIDDNQLPFEDASASTSALTHVHRLGIHHGSGEDYNLACLAQSGIPPKVRSLLCFDYGGLQGLGRAQWLRVLHLKKEASTLFDDYVFRELVHLKYLRIRGVKSLPPSINKLHNLQTLDLGWTSVRLPTEIWSLHRLRHLIARGASFDGHPQLELLRRLHTLELVAGEWIEEKSLIKLSELRNLWILEEFEDDVTLEEFGEVLIKAIQQMLHLKKLRLQGRGRSVLPPFKPFNDNSQLEEIILIEVRILQEQPQISLEFPPKLTTLVLIETYLEHDPLPTLGKLTNLRLLTFANSTYLGSKLTMPKQGFPQLERLNFIELPYLKEWIVEDGAMPTLKHLEVHHCYQLKMLPKGLQHIVTLKELVVEMPNKFCQRLAIGVGEDWHKIKHIPSVIVCPRGMCGTEYISVKEGKAHGKSAIL